MVEMTVKESNRKDFWSVANASHRPPPYVEWVYLHFAASDGTALNMVLHETDIFGLKRRSYLSLSLLSSGRRPLYLRRELEEGAIGRDGPYLRVGEGMIREDEWTIAFDVIFPGRGYFRGEICKLAPPLAIQNGVLYEEPETGCSSHWVVQVPHATFTGLLEVDGVTRRLQGMAYQDHQWGTVRIQEFVSDWVWGHFSNEQMAAVFFQILTRRGQLIERVALVTEEGQFTGTALESSYLEALFATGHPETFEDEISISFLHRQLHFTFEVSPARLMRCRLGEAHGRWVASYLRWAAAAASPATCGGQPLHGISEYIRIRPAIYGEPAGGEHH